MSSTRAYEGQWYVDRAHHEFFLVIAIDESDGVIDVRDRYGDIDEFDLDEWESMGLVLCTPPGEMPGEMNADWDGEEWDAEDEDSEERPAN